jgi:ribonuclease HI
MMTEVSLFVDGSCRSNPGPGGYCAILENGRERVLGGSAEQSTNNRMELTAVLAGLLRTYTLIGAKYSFNRRVCSPVGE